MVAYTCILHFSCQYKFSYTTEVKVVLITQRATSFTTLHSCIWECKSKILHLCLQAKLFQIIKGLNQICLKSLTCNITSCYIHYGCKVLRGMSGFLQFFWINWIIWLEWISMCSLQPELSSASLSCFNHRWLHDFFFFYFFTFWWFFKCDRLKNWSNKL